MELGVEREAGESRDAAGVPAEVVLVGGEGILFPGFAGLSWGGEKSKRVCRRPQKHAPELWEPMGLMVLIQRSA